MKDKVYMVKKQKRKERRICGGVLFLLVFVIVNTFYNPMRNVSAETQVVSTAGRNVQVRFVSDMWHVFYSPSHAHLTEPRLIFTSDNWATSSGGSFVLPTTVATQTTQGDNQRMGIRIISPQPLEITIAGTTHRTPAGATLEFRHLVNKHSLPNLSMRFTVNGATWQNYTMNVPNNNTTYRDYYTMRRITFTYYNPVVTSATGLTRSVGSAAVWGEGVSGRSGGPLNQTLTYANGGVEVTNFNAAGTHTHLSSNGTTFDRVGRVTINYRLRDSHSRDTSNPNFTGDNTAVTTSRVIQVTTTQAPTLTLTYGSGSVSTTGASIAGSSYSSTTSTRPCGGEDGWTRHPLVLRASRGSIPATNIATVLRAPSMTEIVTNNADAVQSSYHVQSANTSGSNVSGVLAQVGSVSNTLSGTANATVKIDRTAPVANVTHNGNFNFTDTSSDALSGKSVTRPTQMSFVTPPTASTTPPTTGWANVNVSTPTTPGQYDVWVRATDKAGNVTTRKVFAALSRTTTQSPTLTFLYATAAVSPTGASITNQTYSSTTSTRPCGGEDGWTRQPLALRVSRGSIPQGHFSNVLRAPSIADVVTNNADAVRNPYQVQSANTSGSTVSGVLTQVGNTSSALSGTASGIVKIDTTAPVANVTHNGNFNFTDTSSDALSGKSVTRPTQMSFVTPPTASTTPPTTGWANVNVSIPTTPGQYDVWVRATDKAGNITTRKVFAALARTTTQSPTLTFTYAMGAVSTTGTLISGSTYSSTSSTRPCGGEDGWTRQPLVLSVSRGTIPQGHFSNVLRAPSISEVVTNNTDAVRNPYQVQSANTSGSTVSGVLTQVGNTSNALSGTASGIVKIDTTAPIADATYDGGVHFTDTSSDALSGKSVTRPTQINLVSPPTASMTPPTTGWTNLNAHGVNSPGQYDVWIRATDKAGNITTRKVFAALSITGEVELRKSTDADFTSHIDTCLNANSLTLEIGCDLACSEGTDSAIPERSEFNYKIQLKNTATIGSAAGTFEDYLPKGVEVDSAPIATPSTGVTVNYALETSGTYTGRYKVSGNYSAIAAGAQIEISIACIAPKFDTVTAINNIFSNQATSTWTIGPPATPIGPITSSSNHVLHEVFSTAIPVAFTKVSADSLSTGLANVEFALYRWTGLTSPTPVQRDHMVDTSVLADTIMGESWVRVKYDGEEATTISEGFVSSASPLGLVDFGRLHAGIYTLVETKSVSGYALPVGQWLMTIDPDKTDVGAGDYKIEFAGKSASIMPPAAIRETSGGLHTYKIINARPFTVGMSGLGGSKGMLLVGFAIMVLAGNVYIVYSYRQEIKDKASKAIKKTPKG